MYINTPSFHFREALNIHLFVPILLPFRFKCFPLRSIGKLVTGLREREKCVTFQQKTFAFLYIKGKSYSRAHELNNRKRYVCPLVHQLWNIKPLKSLDNSLDCDEQCIGIFMIFLKDICASTMRKSFHD